MMLEKYLSQISYNSYEEFYNNFEIKVPAQFNFAFDVVDEIAKERLTKQLWCGAMITATNFYISAISNFTAIKPQTILNP